MGYRLTLTALIAGVVLGCGAMGMAQETGKKRQEIVTTEPLEAPGEQPAPPTDPLTEFIESTKQPLPWMEWGADLRLRQIYFDNAVVLSDRIPGHERNFGRYRARLWTTLTPIEDLLTVKGRLTWEGRYYDKPRAFENWYDGPVMVDKLNFELKHPGDLPLSLKVGRQDIILGNGWLVLDGTPLDGSRTIYSDALKLTWDISDTNKLDLYYIDQDGEDDRYIPSFNGPHGGEEEQIEQEERGVIGWYTWKPRKVTEVNALFIYKHLDALPGAVRTNVGAPFNSFGDNGEIYTFGGRVVHSFNDHWKLRFEGAYQFGHKQSANPADTAGPDLSAFGFNGRLTYSLKDEWNTQFRLSWEYLSGDDPDSDQDEEFDPLWGRWPQFSELYVYTYAPETRIGEVTNLHRLGFGVTTFPVKQLELCADYHLLMANENTRRGATVAGVNAFAQDGDIRGHLFTALLRYKISPHVFGHLIGEVLLPGDYYHDDYNDTATFLRGELTLRW